MDIDMGVINRQQTKDGVPATFDWLDQSGRFKLGKHEGRLAEDVYADDPSYIRWVIDKAESISDDDRELLRLLTTHTRRRG